MTRLIDANRLLLRLRGDLDEARFERNVAEAQKVDAIDLALRNGYIEALEHAVDQVERRAEKAAKW